MPRKRRSLGSKASIRLAIKGNKKNATREAARRKIPVWGCMTRRDTTYCDAPCSKEVAVARWYIAHARTKPGRGFPPGTLTHYSAKSCERKR